MNARNRFPKWPTHAPWFAQKAIRTTLRDGRWIDDLRRFLGPWREAFRAVAAAPNGLNAMLAVFRYLSRVSRSDQLQLETFARDIGPTAERATMTAAEEILERGREEGRQLERRDLLVKLITLRFGPPDSTTLDRLERATAEQLSRCAELVLDAATIDNVLDAFR